jgi:hypothetical protein
MATFGKEAIAKVIGADNHEENGSDSMDNPPKLKTGREEKDPSYDWVFGKEEWQACQHQEEKTGDWDKVNLR